MECGLLKYWKNHQLHTYMVSFYKYTIETKRISDSTMYLRNRMYALTECCAKNELRELNITRLYHRHK